MKPMGFPEGPTAPARLSAPRAAISSFHVKNKYKWGPKQFFHSCCAPAALLHAAVRPPSVAPRWARGYAGSLIVFSAVSGLFVFCLVILESFQARAVYTPQLPTLSTPKMMWRACGVSYARYTAEMAELLRKWGPTLARMRNCWGPPVIPWTFLLPVTVP